MRKALAITFIVIASAYAIASSGLPTPRRADGNVYVRQIQILVGMPAPEQDGIAGPQTVEAVRKIVLRAHAKDVGLMEGPTPK